MSNQDRSRATSTSSNRRESADAGQDERPSKSSDGSSSMTEDASAKAKQLALDAAETVTQQTKRLLDGQLGAGADLISAVASATRRASSDLEQQSPQVAKFVHSIADRVDTYSDQLRDQSVDDLVRAASRFTRQQPALVFGLAALAGFFALRVVRAAPASSTAMSSPSIQPYSEDRTRHAHGTRTH